MASYHQQQGGNTFMAIPTINFQMYSEIAGDDEWWEYIPCPFCYIEVEVPFLCDHLQEEHCFDMKNAVCPICADNLDKDTDEHFRVQHSHLLKRRKSSSFSCKPSSAAADKGSYEEDSYFEAPSHCMGRPAPDSSPDPLLSQFICCSLAPPVDSPRRSEADAEGHGSSSSDDQKRREQGVMDDASKEELEERLQIIEFVKQMLMTTIAY
ncbi:protein DEHYDRATION-INDUCED 19 homolog 6 isoform X2 [Oryza glaberrima]|uniref:Drought induced 19 protein type zinc-binding domain-containing protein n=1 Tax=Oryza barthii TaxID=65489 RepID=A0A0D3G2D0_9ORYZ|nr:protein DEHYDRATION-INDUCED 19 homolog 6 isoform X2 [Oryza glaberrima]